MKYILLFLLSFYTIGISAQQVNSIQEAMSNYDYEKAIELIDQQKPTTPLLYQKAIAQKGLNRFFDATKTLLQLTEKEPDNQRFTLELAECYKQAGKFNDALKCYRRILVNNPENKYAHIQLITILNATEHYADAEKACLNFMQKDSSAVALRLMAQTYQGLARPLSAITCYEKVVEAEPNDNASVARLANLYIKTSDFQNAIDVTEAYRKIDANNLYVNRQNAQAYCLIKDYDKAIERYKHLVNQGDSTMHTCYYLGMSYYAKEKFYEAHDFLRVAYKYEPKNINVLYYLGRACAKTSWKKEGVELMEEAINLTIPSDSVLTNLYNGLVECAKFAGMPQKRIDAYKELYKLNPQKHTILYSIGSIYQATKDYKNAIRYLERFLKTKPKDMADDVAIEEGEGLVLTERTYYKAAEQRIQTIKEDEFFRMKAD